jgi:Protein of unknown function (DUF1360)
VPDPEHVSGGNAPEVNIPLGGYALLTAVFNGTVAAYRLQQYMVGPLLAATHGSGRPGPARSSYYKLTRTITTDRVTSFLRSPFTRYTGEAGPSEPPRGRGVRRAVGELLVSRTAPGSGWPPR